MFGDYLLALSAMFVIFVYAMIKMRRSLHMLQQNLYNENNRYLKWVKKNKNEIYKNLDLFGIVFAFLFDIYFYTVISYYFLGLLVLVYIVSTVYIFKNKKKEQNKKPLVITARVKRLIVTTVILYLLPSILGLVFSNFLCEFVVLTSIMAVFNFYVVYLAKVINTPIEKLVYRHYERCWFNSFS